MSGFDDIINNLDKWVPKSGQTITSQTQVIGHDVPQDVVPIRPWSDQPKARPEPPRFNVGDLIVIRETRWPPETGRVNQRTGLYADPGYPSLPDMNLPKAEHDWEFNRELHRLLKENLVGTVNIGDVCKIIAVWCHEDDKTYYFLDNKKVQGWTRCSYRFRHATQEEKRRFR